MVIITLTTRGLYTEAVTTLSQLPERLATSGAAFIEACENNKPGDDKKPRRLKIVAPKTQKGEVPTCSSCQQPLVPGFYYCLDCWEVLE
ncbi:MAG: hypothetical protein HPY50_00195 [Firmicutes bacterium]|nr:hypothetical protein [Bacillota bacterium]